VPSFLLCAEQARQVESHEASNDNKALADRIFMKFRGPKAQKDRQETDKSV
jgi:hypothetical protein